MSANDRKGMIIIKDSGIEAHHEIQIQQRHEKCDLQIQEFEQRIKDTETKLARSEEWWRKKRERDALKVIDMTPWIPKNITQKEIDDYCVRHPDNVKTINNTFKTKCQRVQVLRECVILAREAESDLKRWYRASLKKYNGLNKNEIKKIIKDIENRNPEFFKV